MKEIIRKSTNKNRKRGRRNKTQNESEDSSKKKELLTYSSLTIIISNACDKKIGRI